jgi:hypothetical protein
MRHVLKIRAVIKDRPKQADLKSPKTQSYKNLTNYRFGQ